MFPTGRVFSVHFPRDMIKFEPESKINHIGDGSFAEKVGFGTGDVLAPGGKRRGLHGDRGDEGRVGGRKHDGLPR